MDFEDEMFATTGPLKFTTLDFVVCARHLDAAHTGSDPADELLPDNIRSSFQRALPDDGDTPSGGGECLNRDLVSFLVASELGIPEVSSRLGQREQITVLMAVPEATMYEYHGVPFRQNEIWPTGKGLGVKPVSDAGVP